MLFQRVLIDLLLNDFDENAVVLMNDIKENRIKKYSHFIAISMGQISSLFGNEIFIDIATHSRSLKLEILLLGYDCCFLEERKNKWNLKRLDEFGRALMYVISIVFI